MKSELTRSEEGLIQVLSGLSGNKYSVRKICKFARIDEKTYYRAFKKDRFKEEAEKVCPWVFQPKITRPSSKHISQEEYNKLLVEQNYRCAICKNPETRKINNEQTANLSVDHNHKTNTTRGLLCAGCNFMLGFAKDSILILQSAISYLVAHP